MNKKYIILVILSLVLILPNLFSYQSLSVDLETTPDNSQDIFYISQNTELHILFNISSDYKLKINNKPVRVEYSLATYPEKEIKNTIKFNLSKKEANFISDIKSKLFLNIKTNSFTDNTVNVKVNAKLYDEYNNLIESSYKFIKIKSNNSEYYFTYTKNKSKPELRGVNFSRDLVYLINKEDSDIITVKELVDYDYIYNIECTSNNPAIIVKTNYKLNKEFDMNFYIDPNKNITKGTYFIECSAFNKDNIYKLKKIKLNYLDIFKDENKSKNIKSTEDKNSEKNNIIPENKDKSELSKNSASNISAFLNFKSTTNIILILIGIVLLIIILL